MDKENVLVRIYELRDPRDVECKPRYVGITKRKLKYRLQEHVWGESSKTHTYKNIWIKKLLKEGVEPIIYLIEEVKGWDYACKCEKYWIKEFREQGYKLTNLTSGGEGLKNYKHSKESRQKISNAGKNKVFSKERKEKISKALMGNTNGKNATSIYIHQYDLNNNLLNIYKSFTEAAKNIGISSTSGISQVCNKKNRTCKGFIWKCFSERVHKSNGVKINILNIVTLEILTFNSISQCCEQLSIPSTCLNRLIKNPNKIYKNTYKLYKDV